MNVQPQIQNCGPRAYSISGLRHGFHETKQGVRFSIREPARREILDRLLALNHERYAEEVKAGLHDKGAKKKGKRGKAKSAEPEGELF